MLELPFSSLERVRFSGPWAGRRLFHRYHAWTVRTGHLALAITRAATLPSKRRVSPLRPCVPITIHVGALPPGDANDLLVWHAGLDEQARGAHARRFRSGHEHAQLSLGKVTLTCRSVSTVSGVMYPSPMIGRGPMTCTMSNWLRRDLASSTARLNAGRDAGEKSEGVEDPSDRHGSVLVWVGVRCVDRSRM